MRHRFKHWSTIVVTPDDSNSYMIVQCIGCDNCGVIFSINKNTLIKKPKYNKNGYICYYSRSPVYNIHVDSLRMKKQRTAITSGLTCEEIMIESILEL